ncbi:hypothetical protein BASA61_005030 [Batrachochytrium salamandrivorans]|nr:hypothetical protein BASA61_005030 [Batrachochytrium salamandrivorans]
MQLSTLFLSTITAVVCVNAATIPSHIKADNQNNLLQARSYDSVDSGNEAHLERRSPGYATPNFGFQRGIGGFGGSSFINNGFVNNGFVNNGFGGFGGGGFGGGFGGRFGGSRFGMCDSNISFIL